jgi:CheY-like chemotaxis protein
MPQLIIVVDDMEPCREVTSQVLQILGYRTLSVGTCAEALAAAENAVPEDELLVFTDINLPEMSGVALVREILKVRPEAKVVYTSGDSRNSLVRSGLLREGEEFLPKPYSTSGIASAVMRATQHPFPQSTQALA